MFETQSRTIDGTPFKVTQFAALEALRLQAVLLMKIAPALGRALGALDGSLPKSIAGIFALKINGAEFSAAVDSLFQNLPEDELIPLVRRLLQGVGCETSVEGKTIWLTFDDPGSFDTSFNLVFGGRTFLVYQVIKFVLEVNYPDLFKMLGVKAATGSQKKTTVISRPRGKSESQSKNDSAQSGS